MIDWHLCELNMLEYVSFALKTRVFDTMFAGCEKISVATERKNCKSDIWAFHPRFLDDLKDKYGADSFVWRENYDLMKEQLYCHNLCHKWIMCLTLLWTDKRDRLYLLFVARRLYKDWRIRVSQLAYFETRFLYARWCSWPNSTKFEWFSWKKWKINLTLK